MHKCDKAKESLSGRALDKAVRRIARNSGLFPMATACTERCPLVRLSGDMSVNTRELIHEEDRGSVSRVVYKGAESYGLCGVGSSGDVRSFRLSGTGSSKVLDGEF